MFPYIPVCPTQPLVTIKNIIFRNIFANNTIPLFEGPGVILCDKNNPCTNLIFDNFTNVMFTGNVTEFMNALPIPVPDIIFPTVYRDDDWEFQYITTYAYGDNYEIVNPVPCLDDSCWWTPPTHVPTSSPTMALTPHVTSTPSTMAPTYTYIDNNDNSKSTTLSEQNIVIISVTIFIVILVIVFITIFWFNSKRLFKGSHEERLLI